ncbi:amino acid ABC transporter substrate-binding protein [Oceanidesulfovibrio indonesiensis]|uniref:Amino acid ABC transporter substrate-binding protein n=1 Tax=Oceanidesulfovibrio indonesiensis TaxID=54767 RepID=A0A7M3MIG5_9BACT|nr:transporter substrate-binding domain-containing protein [Oceanidesulfovibrio indonesiensis]TVM19482.1 amino acid ABC transporter substrate-binding protein [Oceanidesulfovibrio indonesiensis]
MKAWRFIQVTALIGAIMIFVVNSAEAESVRNQLAQESTIEKVLQRGVLKVGMDTFVPWAMKNKDGELIGFEIDVAKQLAEDLGVEVEFVPTKWSGIIPSLLTGKFDVIIGGMSTTTERNLKVNFTVPYNYTGQAIVANRKLAPGLSTLEDFNREDFTVTARTGSTAAVAAKKFLPKAKLVLFDTEPAALQEILNDKAHVFVSSAPLPAFKAIEHPDKLYLPFEDTITKEPTSFAVLKGDVDTLNIFDNWIRRKELEGWLQERAHHWFNTRDWAGQVE